MSPLNKETNEKLKQIEQPDNVTAPAFTPQRPNNKAIFPDLALQQIKFISKTQENSKKEASRTVDRDSAVILSGKFCLKTSKIEPLDYSSQVSSQMTIP